MEVAASKSASVDLGNPTMSLNKLPTSPLIRRRDVLAYYPTLSLYQLQLWEQLKLIDVFRPTKTSKRMYYTAQIEKLSTPPQH